MDTVYFFFSFKTVDCPKKGFYKSGLKWFNKQNDWSILAHAASEHPESVCNFTKHHRGKTQILADSTH